MSRIVGASTIGSSISMHGINQNVGGTTNVEAVRDFARFQSLYLNVLRDLNVGLGYFTNTLGSDWQNLIEFLKTSNTNAVQLNITNTALYENENIINLTDFVYDPTLFNKYKIAMQSILSGLEVAGEKQLEITSLINEVNTLTPLANILNSNQAIITQYITSKKLEILPFNAETVYVSDIILKPWYSSYLFKYGAPANGVFDIELLTEIVDELILSGTITLDEFINSGN